MHSIKETVAASAKSGMEKTKAALQEKPGKMIAHSATEKEIATMKKEERAHRAEVYKQKARAYSYSTTGEMGQAMGGDQMSALPGLGTGEPAGQVTEGHCKVSSNRHWTPDYCAQHACGCRYQQSLRITPMWVASSWFRI